MPYGPFSTPGATARNRKAIARISLLVATALVAMLPTVQASAAPLTGVSPEALADAISAQPALVVGSEFTTLSSPQAVAVSSDRVSGFPRSGDTYGILSSGSVDRLLLPNNSGSDSTNFGTSNRGAYDVTVLRLDLEVPVGMNCLTFDFRFLSEEFPEYVGSSYNDAFLAELLVAELGESTWTTSGSQINAPDNFAFDPEGNPITINAAGVTSMTADEAAGTTYDGATPLLSAATPVTPGRHPLYLSIFDKGDHVLDSSVLLDSLRTFAASSASECRPGASLAGNGNPDWGDWHAGDVHAHATGDTSLALHPECKELAARACAEKLVNNTLQRAKRFGTEWVVFTEHIPWLGFDRDGGGGLYDSGLAASEWTTLREAAGATSTDTVRGLVGAELGTAIPACTDIDADVEFHGPGLFPPKPPTISVKNFAIDSPGHYGVYSTPSFINDSILDCNETGDNSYVGDTTDATGFGGINHPDAEDGGSPWHCYTSERTESGELRGREEQPEHLDEKRCAIGIDQFAGDAFRTMEIINGNNIPSAKTLNLWDMFLQNGHRIAAVGGSDGHTATRGRDARAAAECVLKRALLPDPFQPTLKECFDEIAAVGGPNHNKVGGSGRTFAYYGSGDPVGSGYDSADPADPARMAMSEGRTTASNGPGAIAQINGQFQGSTVGLPGGEHVELRVDWQRDWRTVGDSIGDDRSEEIDDFDLIPGVGDSDRQVTGETPDRIVVVTGETDGCGRDRSHCGSTTDRKVIRIVDGVPNTTGVSLGEDHANITIEPPADGYVRVELFWDVPQDDGIPDERERELELARERDHDYSNRSRFILDDDINDGVWDFAAYTSPIFVERTSTALIDGTVVDGVTGVPVAGAQVELCRSSPTAACVTRTTKPDGTFTPVVSKAGTWRARAFPPSGVTGRGAGVLDMGPVAPDEERTIMIELPEQTTPPFIDPSGSVIDTDGNPIQGATVTLSAADNIDGPFVALADGSAVMSPANRTNPTVTGEDGTFGWDVLAGWYEVKASKPGCTSELGEASASSGALQIPPPALDLRIVLDCRAADDKAPLLNVAGAPGQFTNQTSLDLQITVTDEQPSTATCLIDPEYEAESGQLTGGTTPCADGLHIKGLTEGRHVIVVVATDHRENTSAQFIDFVVDTTAPSITVEGAVDDGVYPFTSAPNPSCSAEDALSGLAAPCEGSTDSPTGLDAAGTWSYTASATDRAGNTSTVRINWLVQWPFGGFSKPALGPGELHVAKAGSAIPTRFNLGGDRGLAILADGAPRSAPVACGSLEQTGDASQTNTPGASGLSYAGGTDQYSYVWKTDKSWSGSCRSFILGLADGSEHRFAVRFK